MRTKLRYATRVEFVPTGTTIVAKTFLANGLYDPDTTLGGHQPRGFDEFMAAYTTFTVQGSKASCSFMYEGYDGPSVAATAGNLGKTVTARDFTEPEPALTPMICGMHKGTDAIGAGTGQDQIEKDRTVWTFINGQSQHGVLRNSLSVGEFFGKHALTGAEGYTGTASGDPTEQVYWSVWCGRVSDDYPAEKTKVIGYMVIEYDVIFTEPKSLSQS